MTRAPSLMSSLPPDLQDAVLQAAETQTYGEIREWLNAAGEMNDNMLHILNQKVATPCYHYIDNCIIHLDEMWDKLVIIAGIGLHRARKEALSCFRF